MKIIKPDWPAPEHVIAFSTTREEGHSRGSYEGLNIAHHVGDDSGAVALNREILCTGLPPGTSIQWLAQEHGCKVVRATDTGETPCADASWTNMAGVACAVMTADCLPVLFCSKDGDRVASAHAGWRGLYRGVLEACVAEMAIAPSRLIAWMGPAIGPGAFEVGGEVKEHFMSSSPPENCRYVAQCFKEKTTRPGHFHADIYALARMRLNAIGVSQIYGGGLCTFSDSARFFSYRRDGTTGRMATIITISPT